MPGDTYPKFKAASVQAAPVFLDRDATIEKLEKFVKEAKMSGADIVVFPESFIPTYPLWCIVHAPIDQHELYKRLFENAVLIGSPAAKKLGEIARANKIFLSVGVTEKSDYSMGAMWNTNLLFDRSGKLINRHRKIMPTWAEKLVWNQGDGSQLKPENTELGKIGALICGENTNTLCRYALLAQGEQVHISTYPPAWPFRRGGALQGYDVKKVIHLRSAAHSFEGKVFNIASSGVLDEDAINQISLGDSEVKSFLEQLAKPASMITDPTGEVMVDLVGEEGIIYADIDISQSIILKAAHDIIGYYQRFDIFQVHLNQTPLRPINCYNLNQKGREGDCGCGTDLEENDEETQEKA
jgi:nitrilase